MDQSIVSLHTLPPLGRRSKKRVGRGYGSGKGGHTSGRGQKGQKSRRTIPWSFEGGALPLSQRLPFWRGKGRLNPLKPKPIPVNIGQLERFPDGTVIDLAFLVKERIIHQSEADTRGVKILGDGKLTKKLTIVGMRMSQSAKAAIEKVGGAVMEMRDENEERRVEDKERQGNQIVQVEQVEKVAKTEKRVTKQKKTQKPIKRSAKRVLKPKTVPKKKTSKQLRKK
jgi:large subunit ribosomal protein L15